MQPCSRLPLALLRLQLANAGCYGYKQLRLPRGSGGGFFVALVQGLVSSW